MTNHEPVLLKEVTTALEGKVFIDATVGAGGHTRELLKKGKVLAIDRDREAVELTRKNLGDDERLVLVQGDFAHLEEIAKTHRFTRVDGTLFDLGLGTFQLNDPERGFSFRKDGPLDMRFDQNQPFTAVQILNGYPKHKLEEIFKKYGDIKKAQQLAEAICEARKREKIRRTVQLKEIIEAIFPRYPQSLPPATQVFQALRIETNQELEKLKEALPQAVKLLREGGRIAVISFHSGEDRIVKHFFKNEPHLKGITKKPIQATFEEIKRNPRSKSAKLRIGEKC